MSGPEEALPFLLTKVQVPRRSQDVLRRQRLVEALHQNLHRKLIFVTAPAGFGKTTLLVDFAAEAPAQVAWYHITAEDQALTRFVRYLAWAVVQAYPELREAFQDLFEGGLPWQDPKALAAWLNSLLAERVNDFTLLILDDYHLVGEQLEIVDFVEAWLEHLPDQIRLIIASRSVYGIPTTRLYLRNELALIGPDDLRFNAEELQALARQAYGIELPEDYAQDLAQRTDGWVIAILLAIRLRTEGRLPSIRGEREELYTFLAEEVLRYLPPYLVRFLLDTSVLDEFTPMLCQTVLEEPQAAKYLQEIEDRNLFVTRLDTPQGTVYRYHQLFAEFLRSRLQEEDRQRWQALHRRAALWYEEQGNLERAVAHRLAAGDREGAAPWMDAAAREMFMSGRWEVLRQWTETLAWPPDLRPRAPRLLLYQAKVLTDLERFEESQNLLRLAQPPLEQLGDPYLLANLFEAQGFNAYLQGRYAQARALAQRAEEQVADRQGAEAVLRRAQARRVGALAAAQLGEVAQAVARLEEAAQDLEQLLEQDPEAAREGAHNLALVLQDLGVFYFRQGRLADAVRALEEERTLWRRYRLNPGNLPAVLNNLAFLYQRSGQQERAVEVYREGIELARRQRSRWLAVLLSGLGEVYIEERQWDLARKVLLEALEVARQHEDREALAGAHLSLAKLEAVEGRFAQAFMHLRQGAVLRHQSQHSPWFRWRAGQLHWLLGQPTEAREALEPLWQEAEGLEPEERARLGLVLASLVDRPLAKEMLQEALKEISHLGYVNFLRLEAWRLRRFLHEAQERWPHPVLRALVDLAEKRPLGETGAPQAQVTPRRPALRVRGLGPGEVWLGEERIPNAAWRAAGARALFFYILDQGPVRKGDLTLAFWPDFSPAQVNSNLHATLWRVRRALGDKTMIQVREGRYQIHPEVQVDYDVRRFEEFLQKAAATQGQERLDLLEQAAQLYQGDFLSDLDFPWIDERRYTLQQRYREALGELIQGWMERGAYPQAMRWLEKALALDPYNDQWHLDWLRCLVATGHRASAKEHYRRYRQRLRRELGVEPDEQMRRFAEAL